MTTDGPKPCPASRGQIAQAFIAAFRERYQRAKAKGQVELHVAMRDVDALLALAQPTVNALLRREADSD